MLTLDGAMAWFAAPRTRIDYGQGETVVHLPIKRNVFSVLGTMFFMAFGGLGGLLALVMVSGQTGDLNFYRIWIIGWVVAMGFLIVRLLWALIGSDRLIIRSDGVIHVRSILIFRLKQVFSPEEALAISFEADDPTVTYRVNNRRIPQTSLKMWSNGRWVRFAKGISAKDAKDVIAAIAIRAVRKGRRE